MRKYPSKKKDLTYAPTTAAYAIVNNCWSLKRLGIYFSPDGEAFHAPSGLQRYGSGWKSISPTMNIVCFLDSNFKSHRECYEAALKYHTAASLVLVQSSHRSFNESVNKTIPTGMAGLFVYPPKNDKLPLCRKNQWTIHVSIYGKNRRFYLPAWATPGCKVFEGRLLKAAEYCQTEREKGLDVRLFNFDNLNRQYHQ